MTKMTGVIKACPARDKECVFVKELLEDKLLYCAFLLEFNFMSSLWNPLPKFHPRHLACK